MPRPKRSFAARRMAVVVTATRKRAPSPIAIVYNPPLWGQSATGALIRRRSLKKGSNTGILIRTSSKSARVLIITQRQPSVSHALRDSFVLVRYVALDGCDEGADEGLSQPRPFDPLAAKRPTRRRRITSKGRCDSA